MGGNSTGGILSEEKKKTFENVDLDIQNNNISDKIVSDIRTKVEEMNL